MRTTIPAGLLAGLLLGPAGLRAAQPDDDLAVVKRAVAERPQAQAQPAPRAAEAAPAPATRTSDKEPQWLRVRIVEKGEKHGKVSINLPLGLVRSLGEELPIEHEGWRGKDGKKVTLGEVLRALDSGQSLVEIEDDEATVRVWVE